MMSNSKKRGGHLSSHMVSFPRKFVKSDCTPATLEGRHSSSLLPGALAEREDLIRAWFGPALRATVGPDDEDSLQIGFLSQSKMDSNIVGAQVAAVRMRPAPQRFLALAEYCHFCAQAETIDTVGCEPHFQPVCFRAYFVMEQPDGPAVVGHEDVHRAVVVNIPEGCSARNSGLGKCRSRAPADAAKPPVLLMEQKILLREWV